MDPNFDNRRSVLQGVSPGGVGLGVSGQSQAWASTAGMADLSIGAPTRLQDIGGVRLAYRRFGKAGSTPLVCVQHFVGTMNNWDPIHTNRLAQDREVILVDYRGVGRSEGQTPDSVQALAADIIAFIRALDLAQVDVFGFSLGGFLAQQIALDAPALVRRLILAGTGPSGGEGMASFSPQVKEIIARPNASADERRLALFFSPSEKSQAAGKAWVGRISARQDDREPEPGPQVAPAQLVAITRWGAIEGERYASLVRITQPTLVVNGHNDIMVPTVNSFILQQRLPDARLVLYPDSGHGAHFQYPYEFAETAAPFLGNP